MVTVTCVPTMRVPAVRHTGVLIVHLGFVTCRFGAMRHVLVRHPALPPRTAPAGSGYPPGVS
ncbi:hypothetical protein QE374_002676 [Microbacterium sp. SORGH_AS428]|nr:hypothetical protein [Microbacterium sp. SORGH_AS_0428]